MRITDNMAVTRSTEMAADRVRDIRQTGLTSGTLNEIARDTEEDLQSVRDRPEVEGSRVRTDSESESSAGQEQQKQEKEEAPPADEDEKLRRRASERLLNLPVSGNRELESKRFDIRV